MYAAHCGHAPRRRPPRATLRPVNHFLVAGVESYDPHTLSDLCACLFVYCETDS
jgi:hypothetical protein